MIWLIEYIKQCFCKHDFEKEESHANDYAELFGDRSGIKVSLLCKNADITNLSGNSNQKTC